MKRLAFVLLALVLVAPVAADEINVDHRVPSAFDTVAVSSGTITCGSTTAACDVNAPLTPTGGTDTAITFDATGGTLASTDIHSQFRNNSTAPIATIYGAGSLTLGHTTPADQGAITISCTNTGTAGCILLANTAASGSTDLGWVVRVVGDLGNSDTPFAVQDNNGSGSIFSCNGGGSCTATSSLIATTDVRAGATGALFFNTRSVIRSSADDALEITNLAGNSNATVTLGTLIATDTSSPASNAACTAGTFYWDSSYVYVCTATGVVKRAAITGGY